MIYFFFPSLTAVFFTSFMKVLAGLNAGILCAGIMMEVFFEMFLAVFSALAFTIKEPNPLKYTSSLLDKDLFTSRMKDSTTFKTSSLSIPVVLEISLTISALVISNTLFIITYLILNFGLQIYSFSPIKKKITLFFSS